MQTMGTWHISAKIPQCFFLSSMTNTDKKQEKLSEYVLWGLILFF